MSRDEQEVVNKVLCMEVDVYKMTTKDKMHGLRKEGMAKKIWLCNALKSDRGVRKSQIN